MSKKLAVLFSGILVIFTLLYVKTASISLDTSLAQKQQSQATKTVEIMTTRGQIYDCNLNPLVDTEQTVLTVPRLEPFAVPKRYSAYQPAQHIIGYIDKTTGKGICGIEREYEDWLAQTSETTIVAYSLDGRMRPLEGVAPKTSYATPITNGVVLTIDKELQEIVERVGFRHIKKGAIVLTEVKTGKLRAAASFPLYNANAISVSLKNPNSPLINRIYTDYSVGSVFKLVTAATALEKGIAPSYTCTGSIEQNGVVFGCHKKTGHGKLNIEQAIAVSCNPYFINLSTMLSRQDFLNMASDLSFGKPYYSGKLPTISELSNMGDFSNLAFGQGALTATPLQVNEMVAAIANGGKAIRTSLVEGVTTDGRVITEQQQYYPTIAMSKATAAAISNMMVTAVMETENQNAKPTKTTAGGKTATAQTGQFKGKTEILHTWFSGFFPAQAPRYCLTVLAEDAQSGNQSASPVFAEIADAITELVKK